jgi:hypothetical protein
VAVYVLDNLSQNRCTEDASLSCIEISVGIFGPTGAKAYHVNPNNSNKISKVHQCKEAWQQISPTLLVEVEKI